MRITSLLASLPGPLWSRVVAPDRVLSMSQLELNCNYAKLNCLKLTVFTFYYVLKKNCVIMLNCFCHLNSVLMLN